MSAITTYIRRHIWVTFQRVGFHCYPNAPSEPYDVTYLANRHRHLFKFKVSLSVSHNEREVEYHQFLHKLESWYADNTLQADNASCETLAEQLMRRISFEHPTREITVEVSEDGECGSVVSYTPVSV